MNYPPKWAHTMTVYIHAILFTMTAIRFGYCIRSGKLYGAPGREIAHAYVLDEVSALSELHCAVKCGYIDDCKSISYHAGSKRCLRSNLTELEITLYSNPVPGWVTYAAKVLLLAFRGPRGIGGDVYGSFAHGHDVATNSVECNDLTTNVCQTNYRHPILDNWRDANITQVRFTYYKHQAEVAYVVFDATGSDMTSWFTKERIVDSSWPLSKTNDYIMFTMGEDVNSLTGYELGSRRFCMHLNFDGCENELTYSIAVISDNAIGCSYDEQTSYPQFIYASSWRPGYPDRVDGGTDKADFLAIFIGR